MGIQEMKKTLESMENVRKDLSSSDDKALAFLIEAGILSTDGEPTQADSQPA